MTAPDYYDNAGPRRRNMRLHVCTCVCYHVVMLLACFMRPCGATVGGNIDGRRVNYQWAVNILGENDQNHSNPATVELVFEVGSRDLLDGNYLAQYYNATVYSFEANPLLHTTMAEHNTDERVHIVRAAIASTDGTITLSLDYAANRTRNHHGDGPTKVVTVNSTRLDTFISASTSHRPPDLLCLDCLACALEGLKSSGEYLDRIKYVIFTASSSSAVCRHRTHPAESPQSNQNKYCPLYKDIHTYLESRGFRFHVMRGSNRSKHHNSNSNVVFQFVEPPGLLVDGVASFLYINRQLSSLT
jgi:FkbM family methyltransferase